MRISETSRGRGRSTLKSPMGRVAGPAGAPGGHAEPVDEHDSRLGRSTLPPLDGERTAPAMLAPHSRRSSLTS
mgnify:CR=1 FL=1